MLRSKPKSNNDCDEILLRRQVNLDDNHERDSQILEVLKKVLDERSAKNLNKFAKKF